MKKLGLVVAVALGTLVACNLATAQEAGKEKKGKRRFNVEQRVEQLKKDLNLTDEQVPKVKALLEKQQKKMQELRNETDQEQRREKMRGIMADQQKEMKGILTDEQYKKWQESVEHAKKSRKKKAE
jgi:protein CpxP